MSYQDDLNSHEWRSKRKKILLRDNLKCTKCHNEELIKDCSIGLLKYNGTNDNGTLFKYYAYSSSELFSKKVFIKKGTVLTPFGSTAFNLIYIDPEFDNEPFARVVAIRELQQIKDERPSRNTIPDIYELPLSIYDEKFKQSAESLKGKMSENYNWKYVPALHVHHSYYQENLLPWEYPDSSLQTLCWVCHEEFHTEQTVPFLDKLGRQFSALTPCTRCYGAGWFPEYKHIEEGICFRCRGAKYEELIQAKYEM